MKISMSKRLKIGFLCGLLILLIACAGGAYYIKDKTKQMERDVKYLNYTLTPNITSQVYLIENNIYDTIYLEDTEVIINQLMNHIYSNSSITLESEEAEYIELIVSQYEVLETYYGEEEHVMWRKPTEPEIERFMGERSVVYSHMQEYSPLAFREFLLLAYEALEISPKALVKIVWDVQGVVARGDEVLEIETSYELKIPILQDMFIIDKESIQVVSDEIVVKETYEVSLNPWYFRILTSLAGLAFVGLLILAALVKTAPENTVYQKMKKRIFSEHNERLAELEIGYSNTYQNMISVVKMDDLVKISDEIRQPIFYHELVGEDENGMEFFVFDEARIYYFVIYEKSPLTFEEFVSEAI